jgi:predicted PurR-regulated permease PerM
MTEKSGKRGTPPGIVTLLVFIAVILAGVVLKVSASITVLMTISVFLACVMSPLVAALERLRIKRFFSIILAGLIIIGGLSLAGFVLFSSGRAVISRLPLYERRLTEIYRWLGRFFDLSYNQNLDFFGNLWSQFAIRNNLRHMTFVFSNGFLTFLKNALMVSLFVVFLLIEAASLKEKIALAFENKLSLQIRAIFSGIAREITRYLSVKFFISLATGLIVGIGLEIINVEFALVWAVIQFILNFIPILGSTAVGAAVSLFALVQFWPEPGPVVATALVMLGSNTIIGSILEPRIIGYNLGISPIVVLFSLLLWGWLWGFAGMVLAVPMMVIIKIICENIPQLEPVSILLGSGKAVRALKNDQR